MISLGLINPKSAANVASILRACGGFGASSVFYTGNRYRYAKDFNADTRQFHRQIPTIGVEDIMAMKPKGAQTVVIELVENAVALPHFTHPENGFYIFGPEDGTVPDTIIQHSDSVVFIPCAHNLNLAATANIVLYDRMAKMGFDGSNDGIKQARDKNNNRRV